MTPRGAVEKGPNDPRGAGHARRLHGSHSARHAAPQVHPRFANWHRRPQQHLRVIPVAPPPPPSTSSRSSRAVPRPRGRRKPRSGRVTARKPTPDSRHAAHRRAGHGPVPRATRRPRPSPASAAFARERRQEGEERLDASPRDGPLRRGYAENRGADELARASAPTLHAPHSVVRCAGLAPQSCVRGAFLLRDRWCGGDGMGKCA